MARKVIINKEANEQIAREDAQKFRLTVAALLVVIVLMGGGYLWLKSSGHEAQARRTAIVKPEDVTFREQDPKKDLDSPVDPVLRTTRTVRINKSPLALKREQEQREALRAEAANKKTSPFAEDEAPKEEIITE
jgi:hypothetical protein